MTLGGAWREEAMQMAAVTTACVSPSPGDWETLIDSQEQVTELGRYVARDFNLWEMKSQGDPDKELLSDLDAL